MRNHETTAELDNPLSSSKIGAYSGSIKATFFKIVRGIREYLQLKLMTS